MSGPSNGAMVWWRFKARGGEWRFGFCTQAQGRNLLRMGRWNGDYDGGVVVDEYEIEWRPYDRN